MNFYIIPAALLMTALVTLVFSLFTKRPLRGFALFFLLVFLATWSGQLWITPFGPVTYGISWISLVVIAVFFSFFITALIPSPPLRKPEDAAEDEIEAPFIVLSSFLWIILVFLILSIAFGYYHLPNMLSHWQ